MNVILCSLPTGNTLSAAYLAVDLLAAHAKKNRILREKVKLSKLYCLENDKNWVERFADKILKHRPDIAAFSCYVWNISNTLKVAKILKSKSAGIKIILGGPSAAYLSEQILRDNPEIDVIVRGEGEMPFNDLLMHFHAGLPEMENIRGITYRNKKGIKINTELAYLRDLDEIPEIDYTLLPWSREEQTKTIAVQFLRGCIRRCAYCLFGVKPLRSFSAAKIKDEIIGALKKRPDMIVCFDGTFNYDMKRLKDMAKELKGTKISAPIKVAADVELITEEQIGIFHELNIKYMDLGIDTINPAALKNASRRIDINKVKRGLKLIYKLAPEMSIQVNTILGLPGDNLDTFKKTIDFIHGNLSPGAVLRVGRLFVFPGFDFDRQKERFRIRLTSKYPHYVRSNYSFSEAQIRKAEEYIEKLAYKNPWVRSSLSQWHDIICH